MPFLLLLLFCFPVGVYAQSSIERHLWQEASVFEPFSRTAIAITGPITLSGNPEFASSGSTMTIAFGDGKEIGLVSEGANWRMWSLSGAKRTAEIFRLKDDPGALLNGNTLCGGSPQGKPLYLAFFEEPNVGDLQTLVMAVFQSKSPPHDINSEGLCGTFSYSVVEDPVQISTPKNESVTEKGKWLSTSVNPLDDSETVVLSLVADSGTSKFGDPIKFIARCKSNKTEAYVIWGDYLGDDSRSVYSEWKYVTVRVGVSKARRERWGISTDRKATFTANWAGAFLKELLDQDRLVLETIPYGENPSTAIFDVSGLRRVLGNLSGPCNWKF